MFKCDSFCPQNSTEVETAHDHLNVLHLRLGNAAPASARNAFATKGNDIISHFVP